MKTDSAATRRMVSGFVLLILLMGQGCADFYAWVRDQSEGASRDYETPFQIVWEAIPAVVKELGPVIVDENKKKGYFLAERKRAGLSYGEKVSIFVEKIDALNTKVRVISKREWDNNLMATNWENPILDLLDKTLNQRR